MYNTIFTKIEYNLNFNESINVENLVGIKA